MSWDNGAANDWKPDGGDEGGFEAEEGFTADTSGGFDAGGDGGFGGGDFGGGDGGEGGGDGACRICNQEGHFARDCPDKKPMECFNCGQVGHTKQECTNERVERPFDGTCNHCGEQGHRKSDCPTKPAEACRLCGTEGHKAMECNAKRTDMFKDAPVMTDEEAWKSMKNAGRDLEIFRSALASYCRFMHAMAEKDELPPVSARDLELAFRKDGFKVYLIAKAEKEEGGAQYTYVSPGGVINQKYLLTLQFSDKSRRAAFADGWPKDAEENLERLASAGFKLDSGIPVCSNCNKKGHVFKSCPEEKAENAHEGVTIKCVICGGDGHRARDCTDRPKDTCRRCKQEGHKAVDCTNPRDASDVECNVCNETGHFSRDCPTKPQRAPRTCRKCGSEDHIAKDCTEEQNPALLQCRNCDEMGHSSRECPKPTDWSRVRCRECGEMGHSIKKCPVANAPPGDGGFNDGGFGETDAAAEAPAAGDWGNDDAGGVEVAASGGW